MGEIMNRKDTILVAVLLNTALLAILFTTAIISDDSEVPQQEPVLLAHSEKAPPPVQEIHMDSTKSQTIRPLEIEEPVSMTDETQIEAPDYLPLLEEETENVEKTEIKKNQDNQNQEQELHYVETKVKKGDSLERIAKTYGTTIAEIKNINNLRSDKINVGQVLKVPTKKSSEKAVAESVVVQANIPATTNSTEPEYYIIKSGDNPWKISKQFHVKYEELLRLNNLDEEKARNLKIGDRIRIR